MFLNQVGKGTTIKEKAINYIFPAFQPFKMPKEMVKLYGFNPDNAVECPDSYASLDRSGRASGECHLRP